MDEFNQLNQSVVNEGLEKKSIGKPLAILVIVAILLIAGLIYVGRKYGLDQPAPAGDTRSVLTETEQAEVLRSLELPPGQPVLTEADKAKILESLE